MVAPQCTVRTVQVPLSGAYSSFIPQKFATRLGVVRQVTYASQPDLTTKLDHGTTTPEVHLNSKNSTGTASSGAAHQESAHLHEGLPAYVITKGTQPLWPSDTDKPFGNC